MVVYSLQAHGAIGLCPLYMEYSISCIKAFITSLRSTGTQSQLAWIALAWAQHVAGTSVPILEDTSTKLPHLTPMQWIPNLCTILNNNNATITTHNTYCIHPQWRHDLHLMDLGLQLFTKPTDVQILNACRLHLQVTLLSDITKINGKTILASVTRGLRPLSSTSSQLVPYQMKPSQRGS